MRFPADFIERLRAHFLISEIIGKRVTLKRHGREHMGLCPFHKEKTPSFTVSDEKNFYHCFGCSAHGDAIGFLMAFEHLSYPEAVEKLAAEAGMELPRFTPQEIERERRAKTLYEVMEAACKWFEQQLLAASGRQALSYLRGRGLRDDTLKEFRLGYAPGQRDGLKRALTEQGFSENLLIEGGLLIVADDKPSYDRFRDRAIFPIQDPRGRVIAFGGRLVPPGETDSKAPKYLNSPETPLFKKGEVLYNFHRARRAAPEAGMAIVGEGYMDVIALARAGFPYAIAPLGTAVTPQHIQHMWRLASEPVICLDGDAAGQRAMLRAAQLALPLLKPGYSLRFAVLPGGEDPDSFLKNYGAPAFREQLAAARGLSDVLLEHCVRTTGYKTPEQKAACERQLMQFAQGIADPVVRSHYREFFHKSLWPSRGPGDKTGKTWKKKPIEIPLTPNQLPPGATSARRQLEAQMMKLLLQFPDLLQSADVEEAFSRMDLSQENLDQMRQAILGFPGLHGPVEGDNFKSYLHRKGFAGLVDALRQESISLPNYLKDEDNAFSPLVIGVWRQLCASLELTRIETEYQEAVEAMASDMSESTYNRYLELRKQIEQAHYRRDLNPAPNPME